MTKIDKNIKRTGVFNAIKSLVLQIATVALISILIIKLFTVENKSNTSDEYQLSLVEQNKKLIEQNRELIAINQKKISLLEQELNNAKKQKK